MASIGGHMRAMVAILRGSAGTGQLTLHAEGMALWLGSATAFPAGSGPAAGKTAALPRIWTEPDIFRAATDLFRAETRLWRFWRGPMSCRCPPAVKRRG